MYLPRPVARNLSCEATREISNAMFDYFMEQCRRKEQRAIRASTARSNNHMSGAAHAA